MSEVLDVPAISTLAAGLSALHATVDAMITAPLETDADDELLARTTLDSAAAALGACTCGF